MKEIIIAKTAGMCYGVKRAINIAQEVAENGGGCTLGDLIHNNNVKADLEKKGVYSIENLSGCPPDKTLIIRTHGIPREIYRAIKDRGVRYKDATCPDVKKLHIIIEEYTEKNYDVIIAGDKYHPEVIALLGHKSDFSGRCFVVKTPLDLEELLKSEKSIGQNPLILLSQTTFDLLKWRDCKKIIKKHYTNSKIFDTICSATINRQEEAFLLAKKCDLMIVIGGRHSSNSRKLYEICNEITETIFIENLDELCKLNFKMPISNKKDIKIGITAGASTPAEIIKEVHSIMSEEIRNGAIAGNDSATDIDFMAEVDKTFKRIYIGNRVKALVVAVNKTEASVDVGTKHSGYIPADELTGDPTKIPSDIVSVGDEIECVVTSINDAEGVVYLSKKRVDAALGMERVAKALDDNSTLEGIVTTVVKGGVIIHYEGARVFIPASQSGVPRTGKLEELQKKHVKFKIVEVNTERNRIVGSIRAALKEENDAKREKFWSEIHEGQKFTGEIKSMESYGVFVDLGGVDGMVHLSELTWNRVKHPKDVVSIGEKLDVYVKSFDPEKRRVSLGAKDPNDNPWNKFINEFKIGDDVSVQIVSITPFGAFAQIIPGVDGLIHISQISLERVTNVAKILTIGQVVNARITDIDTEKTRVSISMKALLVEENEGNTSNEVDGQENSVLAYSDDAVNETEETSE